MFIGEKLVFIRHQHRAGISAKTNKEYEFANVTLSDGLESFTLDVDLSVVKKFEDFRRGDKVVVTLDAVEGFGNNISFVVSNIDLSIDKSKAV